MQIKGFDMVKSINGNSKDEIFLVIKVDEHFLYLVNGKSRKLESPKRKKAKHVLFINSGEEAFCDKTIDEITNSEIRKVLSRLRRGLPIKPEEVE